MHWAATLRPAEMHESERNRIEKEQRALLLAVSDMQQAAAAARALQEEEDGTLARALETAMAVCYMRPFTTSDLQVPDEYIPTGGIDGEAHDHLKVLRDKVHAHTDKSSGRKIESFTIEVEGEIAQLSWREGWLPFPRENLAFVIELCERQAQKMRIDAAMLQLVLDGVLQATSDELPRDLGLAVPHLQISSPTRGAAPDVTAAPDGPVARRCCVETLSNDV